jgi:DNA-binding transcriptional ArsR family regulator
MGLKKTVRAVNDPIRREILTLLKKEKMSSKLNLLKMLMAK